MQRKQKQTGDGTFINAIISAIRDIRQAQTPEVSPVPDDLTLINYAKRLTEKPAWLPGPTAAWARLLPSNWPRVAVT